MRADVLFIKLETFHLLHLSPMCSIYMCVVECVSPPWYSVTLDRAQKKENC